MGVRVRINQYGMRGREYSRKKPNGVYRILLVGDSIALGWGDSEERTLWRPCSIKTRLSTALVRRQASEPGFEVITRGWATITPPRSLRI